MESNKKNIEKQEIPNEVDAPDIIVDNNINENTYIDFIDKHRALTRVISLIIAGIFIYAFVAPLSIEYATIATYAIVVVLIIITFGINSLDKIADILKAFKGK